MLDNETREILEKIKNEINQEYGFQGTIPRINYGPCGVFAKIFFDNWNNLFKEKVHICFVMTLNRDECDHIVIRLPTGELYDGGIGVHDDNEYVRKFIVDEMHVYNEEILEKWSYGLNRTYPRYCPHFNSKTVEAIVQKNLKDLYAIKMKKQPDIKVNSDSRLFIETEHLQLHRPTTTDELILCDLWKNEKVRQFLGGVIAKEMIHAKIFALQDHWNKYGFGQCSVIDKSRNQVIGICGLHHSDDGIELSYMFFPESWGKGLAKEAALTSLDFGFKNLKLHRIIAITQEANKNSCHLLENIGMRNISKFSRFNAIQYLYELTQNEWSKREE